MRKDITVQPKRLSSDRDLRKNVHHSTGSVWISNIPMYDQGNRPECAVAVVRRLLDYYAKGNDVDMRALRSALGYRKEFGTNVGVMVKAIQQYSARLRLRFQALYDFKMTKDDLNMYNKNADSRKSRGKLDQNVLDWAEFVKNLDFKAWRQMRCTANREEQREAWKAISRSIDQGIPVCWGVYLGLVNEQKRRQPSGGHMRLIIGYNAAKNRIYYSDSWGSGHERKEMPWDDAWAITWHLFVLEPMN
ncbi:MAG: C39 family peptidase [Victivallales bacterium]|nr:C39 family peptidase [Victivallales bacterium]